MSRFRTLASPEQCLLSIELLIARYGLLALFIGAGLEGETVVFLGGVLAHRGTLPFWGVALAASAGSFLADQILFFLGRHGRSHPAVQRIAARPAVARITGLLERYPTGFIIAFRFLYGLRTVSPVVIGVSSVPVAKFVGLNALAAILWGPLITAVGYVFGQGLERILGRLPLERHMLLAVGIAVIALLLVSIVRTIRRKPSGPAS